MFRLIRAEIKKTFAKPGIFILTAILICVLFASALLYTPQVRDNNLVSLEIPNSKNTVKSMYEYFKTSSGTTSEFDDNTEIGFNKKIDDVINLINKYYYAYYPESEYVSSLEDEYNDLIKVDNLIKDANDIDEYLVAYGKVCQEASSIKVPARNNLREAVLKLQKDLIEIAKPSSMIIALINEDVKDDLNKNILIKMDNLLNITVQDNKIDQSVFDEIVKNKYMEKINNSLSQFIEFKPAQEVLDRCLEYVSETRERVSVITNEIEDFYNLNQSSNEKEIIKEFNFLVSKFKLKVKNCYDIVTYTIHYDVLKNFPANQITTYSETKDVDIYQMKEDLTRNEYMFKNNTLPIDYATPLSITQTSNDKANAYDFSYFSLRLCLFIIIIYTVVLAASSIAGEQQAGTFKLLAIRPLSRNKLFLGKLLSTILTGFLLFFISIIATFVAGLIKFGTAASLPVLVIFNASTAVTMPVFVEFLIALLTMCFEIVFFVIIAYAISTIFKSNVGAVAVSIFIYFASLILNTIAPSATILRFLPFTNINLFKYFGSSFLSTQASSFLFSILTPTVILGSSFIFSLLLSGLFALIILIVSLIVFNKRDLR